ncbi:MAG: oxidoreductase [Clostridiales bacterium]|nr:oxidoreductase [Clostridiales bacterium]
MNKVALITGASSGIGLKTALELKKQGFIVYGAARRVEKMETLKKVGIHVKYIDVTKEETMTACVNEILKEQGRIDVLINNAGYGSYGAIEDVSLDLARKQLDVNLFGLVRMIQLVLPSMRQHHCGKIVNIASVGGKIATPFGGWYHATKYAVEGLSDSLRSEVIKFGIDVILIEPGLIKTDWGLIAADSLRASSSQGAYAKEAKKTAKFFSKAYSGNWLSKPDLIATTIANAVTAKKPKTRYLVGRFAKLAVYSKRFLSDRLYDVIIRRILY